MVVAGKPFAEILRIASDLHFSLIVMGIRGRHQGGIEEILLRLDGGEGVTRRAHSGRVRSSRNSG